MSRGKALEEPARICFEEKMGISVFERQVINPTFAWMRATLDGLDMDGKVMVEIKCPKMEDHILALEGKIPEKYFSQCQHQMMVTGLDHMYYFSFDGKDGVIVPIEKDVHYMDELLSEEMKFWEMKKNLTPPELTAKDFIDMTGDEKWESMAERYKLFKNEKKRYEVLMDSLKKEMIDHAFGKSCIGGDLMMIHSVVEGHYDMKKIKHDHPAIDWESYRKESSERYTIR
jgi:predicted phage-related endonuclease